ncbi:hypothetical protein V9K67_01650 [Paraflavisolibacter sp. H34]|uniref:hypothetical protein n=1 Tax=Huijunlia imazamoxiresistens TaxID=3127457 RepID=UPI003016981C
MKKSFAMTALLGAGFRAAAQGPRINLDAEIFKMLAGIFFVFLVMRFVLSLLDKILSHRIKNKIVDKGVSDSLATSILQTQPQDNRGVSIKWFSLLAGTGLGLFAVHYTQPLGIHSLAIMALCIALSFLGYFYYLKQSGN